MKTYYDIVGDGGSGILDQVLAQRAAIERNLRQVSAIVAVGSGKGGVGKSTVTLQLSRALADRGQACAVLDADLNGPSQAHLAGLSKVPLLPGRSGLAMPRTDDGIGVVSLGSALAESHELELDSVASGSSQTWRATREFTLFGELLASVEWGALDVLLIDLPPGADRTFQFAEFLGPRARFVLVTAPSALSQGVVARSLAALERAGSEILGYIDNMSGYYCRDCNRVKPLFPTSQGPPLKAPLLGRVPFDAALAERCDRGESSAGLEASPALQEFDTIARSILLLLEDRAQRVPPTDLPEGESRS